MLPSLFIWYVQEPWVRCWGWLIVHIVLANLVELDWFKGEKIETVLLIFKGPQPILCLGGPAEQRDRQPGVVRELQLYAALAAN